MVSVLQSTMGFIVMGLVGGWQRKGKVLEHPGIGVPKPAAEVGQLKLFIAVDWTEKELFGRIEL